MNSNIFTSETTAMDLRKTVLYNGEKFLELFNDPNLQSIVDENSSQFNKNCGELYKKSIKNFGKLKNLEYNVGIGAAQSAGKSAVLNACVLEYPLLPFCTGSTTCVPTILKYGENVEVEISVKKLEEKGTDKEIKNIVTEKRNIKLSCSSISKELFDKMLLYFTKCHTVLALNNVAFFTKEHIDVYGSEIKSSDLKLSFKDPKHVAMLMATVLCAYVNQNDNKDNLNELWIETQKMQLEILRMLGLKDDEKFYTVTIYWNAPLLKKGLVFYDLPGLGSNNTTNNGYLSHEQITKITLNDVQTTIYLFKPEVTEEGAEVISSFLNSDSIRELSSKTERVIAAVNKIDAAPKADVERAVGEAKKQLNTYLKGVNVYKISAQSYGDYKFLEKGIIELHNAGHVINKVKPKKLEIYSEIYKEEIEDNYKDYPMTEFLEALDNLAEKAIYTNILGFIRSVYELSLNVERYAKNRINTIKILQEKIDDSTKVVIDKLQKITDDSTAKVQEVIKQCVDDGLSKIQEEINFTAVFNDYIENMSSEMKTLKTECTNIKDKLEFNWIDDCVISRNNGIELVQPNYENWQKIKIKVRTAKFDESLRCIVGGFKNIIENIQNKCNDMNTPAEQEYEKTLTAVLKEIDNTILSETSKLESAMEYKENNGSIEDVKSVIHSIGNQLKEYVKCCLEDIRLKLNDTDDIDELLNQLTDLALGQQRIIEHRVQFLMQVYTDNLSTKGIFKKSTYLITKTVLEGFFDSAFKIPEDWINELKVDLNPENLVAEYVYEAKQSKKRALLNPAMQLNENLKKLADDLKETSEDGLMNYDSEVKRLFDVLKKLFSELDRGINMENVINIIRTKDGHESELKNVENVKFTYLTEEIRKYIKNEKGDK